VKVHVLSVSIVYALGVPEYVTSDGVHAIPYDVG